MTNEERAKKLRAEIEKTTNRKLCEYSPEEVAQKVSEYLDRAIKDGIKHYLGIDSTWSRLEIRRDSILKKYVDDACMEAVQKITLTPPTINLSEQELASIKRTFHAQYKNYLRERVEEMARKQVDADIKNLVYVFDAPTEE